jgi:hypothetical protein
VLVDCQRHVPSSFFDGPAAAEATGQRGAVGEVTLVLWLPLDHNHDRIGLHASTYSQMLVGSGTGMPSSRSPSR